MALLKEKLGKFCHKLKENECKFCHKKFKNGILKHITKSKICQNIYSDADMKTLKYWAEDKKKAKRAEKRKNNRSQVGEKNQVDPIIQ